MYFSYIKWVNYYSHVNKIVTFFLYTKNFRFIFGSSESCNCRPSGKNQNPLNDLFMQNKTIVLELFDLWSITCIYADVSVNIEWTLGCFVWWWQLAGVRGGGSDGCRQCHNGNCLAADSEAR